MYIYREERINLITIIICWLSLCLLSTSIYLNRNSYDSIQLLKTGTILFLIPSILYFFNKHSRYTKYSIVLCTILLVYVNIYIQNGIFDNVFYLLLSIVLTAVYFDSLFTVYTTFICIISSSILYFKFKSLYFPIFKIDNYVSLQLSFLLVGLIISIQTHLSNKLVQSQQRLYNRAIKDKLTHLYNRTFFDGYFNDTVYEHKRDGKDLSIIVIDVDDFKSINDNFGHPMGDLVLESVSKQILRVCRKEDIPARIGGEEFVILLNETNKDEAIRIAENLRKMVKEISIEGINVTISLGITCLNIRDTSEMFFSRGDKALYQAKNKGKDCFVVI